MTSVSGKLFGEWKSHDLIIIVSGLPRSGTSMMMSMLEVGGIKPVTDWIRKPDYDNPKGYYEYEMVKKIKKDTSWLDNCKGKAVKMVSELLYYLPSDRKYKIVFMRRNLAEMLASQRAMLQRLGREGAKKTDKEMVGLFERHLEKQRKWLSEQNNIKVLYLDYNDIVANPRINAQRISHFFENRLDVDRMSKVVDNSLYRQKKAK